jgi:hypothetical protein
MRDGAPRDEEVDEHRRPRALQGVRVAVQELQVLHHAGALRDIRSLLRAIGELNDKGGRGRALYMLISQ